MSNQGVQGNQGLRGRQGTQGLTGAFGGATFTYGFLTDTNNTDPGTGNLKFNDSDLTSATTLFIDDEDDNSTDIQSYLRTIDDSTSGIKGHFKVSNLANQTTLHYSLLLEAALRHWLLQCSCFIHFW